MYSSAFFPYILFSSPEILSSACSSLLELLSTVFIFILLKEIFISRLSISVQML
jgi:hypothetical protein